MHIPDMVKQFLSDFKKLKVWQQFFFLAAVAGLIFYGLLHGGVIKLPAARAQDCSKLNNATTLEVQMLNGKFQPDHIQTKVCSKLVFINRDKTAHWPAVGPHPTHTSYPGFDAKKPLGPNQQFEFILNRPGDYSFHDHLQETMAGTITISP